LGKFHHGTPVSSTAEKRVARKNCTSLGAIEELTWFAGGGSLWGREYLLRRRKRYKWGKGNAV